MTKLNANLTMLYQEVDFMERFAKAAAAGFKGVEYLFPYPFEKEALAEQLQKHNLEQVLHNLPAGDFANGERGIAVMPDRVGEFQEGVGKAIEYAKALGCKMLNCLVGITPAGVDAGTVQKTLVDNLSFAAKALDAEGIRLLVEPLNSQDVAGFHLVHTKDALNLFDAVGHSNVWLQYDIYHMQIMEGNLARTMKDNLGRIAHMQLADNPGRHEPGTGEINYPVLFRLIDEMGYKGWIGLEYVPAGETDAGMAWAAPYLK